VSVECRVGSVAGYPAETPVCRQYQKIVCGRRCLDLRRWSKIEIDGRLRANLNAAKSILRGGFTHTHTQGTTVQVERGNGEGEGESVVDWPLCMCLIC